MKSLFFILALLLLSVSNTQGIKEDAAVSYIPLVKWKRSPSRDLVGKYAEEYNIDRRKWHKLIELESSWRRKVVHPKTGATGLCQIWPPTARSYGLEGSKKEIQQQLKNPKINIPICARLLSDLLNRYDGDWFLVAIAFNAGPKVITYAQKIARAGKTVALNRGEHYVRRTIGQRYDD